MIYDKIKEKSIFLEKASIKQLLKFIVYSCTTAIVLLSISTIIIEKFAQESQTTLISEILDTETLIRNINSSISSLIIRNATIELAEDIETLAGLSDYKILEDNFKSDYQLLKSLLDKNDHAKLINNYEESFREFLKIDNELFFTKEKVIYLKNELTINEKALEFVANEIVNTVDRVSGKIKLNESRMRLKLRQDLDNNEDSLLSDALLLEYLLGQQRHVYEASKQVQIAVNQLLIFSQKLTSTNNKDALIDLRDNQISQQISSLKLDLNSLSAELNNNANFLYDITELSHSLNRLVNILIENERSIYNLWSQYLNLNSIIDNQIKSKIEKQSAVLVKISKEIEVNLNTLIEANKKHSITLTNFENLLIICFSLTILLFIISILKILNNRINKPLKSISDAVNSLTRGRLTARLNINDFKKDEFSVLAKSFNTFAERNEELFNELSSTYDALLDNEHRLHAILENALVGIVHLQERKFISVNNKFEEMFGYDREQISGLKTEIIFSSKSDFEELGKRAYRKLRENSTYSGEWIVKHKDGREFWCAISAKSIEDGKPELGSIWVYEDITDRKRNEEQLTMLANFDALTGLPNRALFIDRLENYISLASRKNQLIAVMFIDLDRFKQVNDSLGHETGDKLLQEVAKRLNKCVRSSDTVSRLGGDEFTIILTDVKNELTPERTAIKIIQSLRETINISGQEISISPSIGISMFPDNGITVADLLRNSDAAMYHAKQLGRNNFQFYNNEMNSEALNKITLESRLRHAIKNNEFELYFQKQMNVIKDKIVGYEALIRWRTDSGEIIPPDHFIPVLEESGMINSLGEWIITESCRYASLLLQKHSHPITVAINLSARQFQNKNLLRHIDNSINQYKFRPSDLELEITETVLMTGSKSNQQMINELHEMGCQIVLDDFGTGYSSLAYLKQFPIDKLKIDRSFIRDILTDPSDAAICNAIRAMAESLNVHVIAEGVETKEQLDYLLANGFNTVQGFYYGKPEPGNRLISADNVTHLKLIK